MKLLHVALIGAVGYGVYKYATRSSPNAGSSAAGAGAGVAGGKISSGVSSGLAVVQDFLGSIGSSLKQLVSTPNAATGKTAAGQQLTDPNTNAWNAMGQAYTANSPSTLMMPPQQADIVSPYDASSNQPSTLEALTQGASFQLQ